MDSSFFEYRDKTGVESASDTEVIDSSLVVDDSFKAKKKFPIKNQTVFVAESEDSGSGGESRRKQVALQDFAKNRTMIVNVHYDRSVASIPFDNRTNTSDDCIRVFSSLTCHSDC